MSWPPRWLTHDVEGTSRRAQLAIDFVDVFGVITKDSVSGRAGTKLVLRDWQRDLIRNIYATNEDGGYLRRVALAGMPRKNGKSALASHLAVFDLVFGPRGGETYSVAATRDQARIVFGEGEIWISPRLDVDLLERTCRALDRLVVLDKLFEDDPSERKTVMSINETEKLLASDLGLLGFTPSDRARLGLAEIKRQSKLDELRARAAEL